MALLRQREFAACFVCQADFNFWFLLVWVWKSSQDWWNCSYPVSIVIVSGKIDLAFCILGVYSLNGWVYLIIQKDSYQKLVAFLRKYMESNFSKWAFPVEYTARVHTITDYFLRSTLTERLENCICLKERGQGPKPLKQLWKSMCYLEKWEKGSKGTNCVYLASSPWLALNSTSLRNTKLCISNSKESFWSQQPKLTLGSGIGSYWAVRILRLHLRLSSRLVANGAVWEWQ